ncbi:hypothetical protein ANRL1_01594 [Anaerolineae bacterium]|nr:hypothetical protein ANRL1_01594 [Anaerolineae bacterium]
MLYIRGTQESHLEKEKLAKMIADDFGYELFSFSEDRNGDWAALKKKHGIDE